MGLANIVAHGALSYSDCRFTLIDGALVELGIWRSCADEFVGPDIDHAISVLERQQEEITDCCQMLLDTGRRKIVKSDGEPIHLTVIDELAYFSATVGTKASAGEVQYHPARLRCPGPQVRPPVRHRHSTPVYRHRSVVAARPVRLPVGVPLRHRRQLRRGPRPWHRAKTGYTAAAIPDEARGVGLLRAEGKRVPRRVKAAYLTDDELRRIAAHAAILRFHPRLSYHIISSYLIISYHIILYYIILYYIIL